MLIILLNKCYTPSKNLEEKKLKVMHGIRTHTTFNVALAAHGAAQWRCGNWPTYATVRYTKQHRINIE